MKKKVLKFGGIVEAILKMIIIGVSFAVIAPAFGFVLYYLVCFDFHKIIAGCAVLWISIHINKSLMGGR